MRFVIFFFSFIVFTSCDKADKIQNIEKLNGYWEIEKVEKDGDLIKSYTLNETIDYFYVKDSVGFRKKVKPQLDGTFLTNEVEQTFKIYTKESITSIHYDTIWNRNNEIIWQLQDSILILKDQKTKFYFKRYLPLR
ncbi:MAG: hypothetical protein ACK4K1_09540 [Flavobacterium sp.]